MIPCVICGAPSDEKSITDTDSFIYDCFRCGKYLITEEVLLSQDLKNLTNQQKVLISGWIRENQGSNIIIDNKRLKSLNTLPELSLFEKADKMLLYLAKKFPVAGMKLNYKFGEGFGILEKIRLNKIPTEKNIEFLQNANDLLPLVAIGRIIDEREFSHILGYLTNEQNYISKYDTITSKGWHILKHSAIQILTVRKHLLQCGLQMRWKKYMMIISEKPSKIPDTNPFKSDEKNTTMTSMMKLLVRSEAVSLLWLILQEIVVECIMKLALQMGSILRLFIHVEKIILKTYILISTIEISLCGKAEKNYMKNCLTGSKRPLYEQHIPCQQRSV